jgi:hypothetical protein
MGMVGFLSPASRGRLRRALGFALLVWMPLRVALSMIAFLVRSLYRGDLSSDPVFRPYLGLPPVGEGWRDLFLGVWQRWDTLWYMLIAREGYRLSDTRIFAPPLYPWLMRLVGGLFGGGETGLLLGGLIVANLACIAAFAYLHALVEREWGEALARRSVLYVAMFPTAFFLLAAYSESLFLLCTIAAFYNARRAQSERSPSWDWFVAGLWAALAPLARLPGIVIVIPLVVEYVRQWQVARGGERHLQWWRGWPLLLPLLGSLAYPLYVRLILGADSLWAPYAVHQQRFAGRFALPWQSIWQAVRVLCSGEFRIIEPFDLFFAFLFIGLTAISFFRLPLMYALYSSLALIGALTKVGEVQPLLSLSRYVLALFPGFMLLARAGERSTWWNRAIVYPSVALSVFFVGQFVLWGWVG